MRASLNGHGRNRHGPFEVYERGRYFTVTGDHVRGTPDAIEDRQEELEAVLAEFLPKREPSEPLPRVTVPVDVDDQELLEKARRARNGSDFERLYAGHWEGSYPSQSEADLALCGKLAFWCGRDPTRIDRLFRSSGLMRDKWDRADYRESTIDAAIAECRDVYEPRSSRAKTAPTSGALSDEAAPEQPQDDRRYSFMPLKRFLASPYPTAEVLLGRPKQIYLALGSLIIFYGEEGTAKTTLTVDGIAHLAAGVDWLGIPVPRPVKFCVIENEGPAALFQSKLDDKLATWDGDPGWIDNVHVYGEPWGEFTFASPAARDQLSAYCREHKIDVVAANPTLGLGAPGTGSPKRRTTSSTSSSNAD